MDTRIQENTQINAVEIGVAGTALDTQIQENTQINAVEIGVAGTALDTRIQENTQINAVEIGVAGAALCIGVAMMVTAYNGIEKNRDMIKTLACLAVGLYILSTAYALKKLNDAGQLRVIYNNAKAKVEAKAEAKTEAEAKVEAEHNQNKAKKSVVVEPKQQHRKLIDIPSRAAQKQYKKPKQTIGFLSRLGASFNGLINYFSINSKKTFVDATPLPDDSIEFDNEIKTPNSNANKPKKQYKHRQRHVKQPTIDNDKQASPKVLEIKESSSSSSMQIPALTSSVSDDDHASESENESKESFSSSTMQILALTPRKSDNESKVNPATPKNNITLSSVELAPSDVEEKNAPILQSLIKQHNEIKLELAQLQNENQAPMVTVSQPPATVVENISSTLTTAPQLIEEMKATLTIMKEQTKKQTLRLQQRSDLMRINRNLVVQSVRLAELAEHMFPGYDDEICTAAQNFQILMAAHMTYCRELGMDISGYYADDPSPPSQQNSANTLGQYRRHS